MDNEERDVPFAHRYLQNVDFFVNDLILVLSVLLLVIHYLLNRSLLQNNITYFFVGTSLKNIRKTNCCRL